MMLFVIRSMVIEIIKNTISLKQATKISQKSFSQIIPNKINPYTYINIKIIASKNIQIYIYLMDKQQLKLQTALKFWYQHQPTKQNFNQSLIPVATVDTVQKFWSVYQHCKRPSSHEDNSYLYLFKQSIKPVWQDPENQHGGTFVLRFEKQRCDKVWEDIVLGFVARNVGECNLINGVRSKTKKDVQIAEVWVSDARNEEQLEKVRDWIVKITCLNQDTAMEFIKFQVE